MPKYFPHTHIYEVLWSRLAGGYNMPTDSIQNVINFLFASEMILTGCRDGFLRVIIPGAMKPYMEVNRLHGSVWTMYVSWNNLYLAFWDGYVAAFSLVSLGSCQHEELYGSAQLCGSSVQEKGLCFCSQGGRLFTGTSAGCVLMFTPVLQYIFRISFSIDSAWDVEIYSTVAISVGVFFECADGTLYKVLNSGKYSKYDKYDNPIYSLCVSNDLSLPWLA